MFGYFLAASSGFGFLATLFLRSKPAKTRSVETRDYYHETTS